MDIGSPKENHLLARLSAPAYNRLLPELQPVHLAMGQVLHEPGKPQKFAYFPTTAIVALVNRTKNGESTKVAITGCDGLVGMAQILGAGSSPIQALVQTSGQAWCIKTEALKREFYRIEGLMQLGLRYAQALMVQMAQLAMCSRHHLLEQQLCRWLLFSRDRLPSGKIITTQELVASLLGVRRQGISAAATKLESEGIIARERGQITLLNRPLLEERACECYQMVKREHDRLFTPLLQGAPGEALFEQAQQEAIELRRRTELMEHVLIGTELVWWEMNPVTEQAIALISSNLNPMLGYSRSTTKLTLSEWNSRVHPDDMVARAAAMQAHLSGQTHLYESEFRLLHKDGHWIWFAERGKLIERDPAGRPLRMVGTSKEISARKQAELHLTLLARTDPLTGTSNRRHYFEMAEKEFARSLRYKTPLSLLALDLDHFKAVNDRHGHAGGDLVLKQFVQTVGQFLRESDVFGRTGGEEFCVLLPHTDLAGAAALAQRILEAVRRTPALMGKKPIAYTVSMGISQLRRKTRTFAALTKAADQALYQAKQEGRNRVKPAGLLSLVQDTHDN